MKILFIDDTYIYYIKENNLCGMFISLNPDIDTTNIPHLDDVKILYHHKVDYLLVLVYYEHIDGNSKISVIVKIFREYDILTYYKSINKDYTLVNLDLL